MEEANKLIGNGKKYLVLGKAVEAVSVLQEACGLLAKTFGDTADECGEAFFWCGKALLDLARVENSVLGNALEGVPEEDEDEDKPKDSNVESTEDVDEKTRDELRVQVYDAMAEKNEDAEKQSEESKAEGSEAAEQQNTEQAAEDEDGEKPPEAVEKEDKTEEEEETPAQESAAVEDNKTEEEEESADKAEGDVISIPLNYSEAIEALNSSVSVIRSRLEKLQRLLDKAEGPGSLPEEEKELEELKALLPEIQEKVEDANEGLKTTSSAAEAVKKVLDGDSSAFPSSSVNNHSSVSTAKGSTTTAPVSNISHLVRKKRKPEGSPVKEADVKRVKLGDANGHTNKEVAT
uniref:Nuclear autoantigenic sperm protein (Histone-binding) n=1 Tax=Nothobranchius furzeri TaxID=105023 RepID=A0A1A7Z9B2_NOTFU